jgi:hypothetical protein
MSQTVKWAAGSNATFGAGFAAAFLSADINIASTGLISADGVLSSTDIDLSSSPCDQYGQIEADLAAISGGISLANPSVDFYMYQLGSGGTIYGDNQFTAGTPAAIVPSDLYKVASIPYPPGSTAALYGQSQIFMLPFTLAKVRLLAFNNLGAAWATTANSIKFRTLNAFMQ